MVAVDGYARGVPFRSLTHIAGSALAGYAAHNSRSRFGADRVMRALFARDYATSQNQ
jgi:hypothetical protein